MRRVISDGNVIESIRAFNKNENRDDEELTPGTIDYDNLVCLPKPRYTGTTEHILEESSD